MSIWAHPDDESFLAAGVMCAAASQGQTTICVTATKGEAGVQNPNKWPADKIAEIRADELEKALKILGIQHHFWLGCVDGHCRDMTKTKALQKLTKIVDQFHPDSILTFGPDGWTGHEDHKAVYRWAVELVKVLDTNIPIYTVTHTPEHYRKFFKQADEKLNFFFNIDTPHLLPKEQCDIYFELTPVIRQKKKAALAASPSQTETLFKEFDKDFLEEAFGTECFCLAKV